MKNKTAATKKKNGPATLMTMQRNNQSQGRNEDGGIGDERQVGR